MKPEALSILFLPFFEGNPYQKNLARELSRLGYQIIPGKKIHTPWLFFKIAFQYKADIIHIHWTAPILLSTSRVRSCTKALLFCMQMLLLRTFQKKIVWTIHNLRNHDQRFPALEKTFQRLLSRICNDFIVHSISLKRKAIHHLKIRRHSRIHVIDHANYVEDYPNIISRSAARKKLHLPRNAFTLLMFGTIRRNKGLVNAVDTFSKYAAPDWALIVAGMPHDTEVINAIAKRKKLNVHTFFYHIPRDEVQNFFNACDVVLFPYEDVFTSGALHLAMSFKKAVIAPNHDYFKDLIGGTNNFLYGGGPIPGLREAMDTAYSKREKIPAIGWVNYQRIRDHTWERMASQTHRLYESLKKQDTKKRRGSSLD